MPAAFFVNAFPDFLRVCLDALLYGGLFWIKNVNAYNFIAKSIAKNPKMVYSKHINKGNILCSKKCKHLQMYGGMRT